MAKYLDSSGLSYFFGKLSTKFAALAHTHTSSQITDLPTIPTKTSDLTNDAKFAKVQIVRW